MKTDLHRRLQAHGRRPMDPAARGRQLAIIEAAVDQQRRSGAVAHAVRRRPRRRAAVALLSLALLVPAGVGVAAESALPGDTLYPAKVFAESVRRIIDDDIAAEHRVVELEQLVERDAGAALLDRQLQEARREVDALATDHQLRDRLRDLERRLRMVTDRSQVDDGRPTHDQPIDSSTDEQPSDQPATDERLTDPHPADQIEAPATDQPPRETDTDRRSTGDAPADGTDGDRSGGEHDRRAQEPAPVGETDGEPVPAPDEPVHRGDGR